jgi:2-isopropylmalate synthase
MFTRGIDPELEFGDINNLIDVYERVCRLKVHPRHPYAGELVYTAFSGSHQDAINKGMIKHRESESKLWEVPYLPIDPRDVGRTYEEVIRINSQSGKGGVAYIMEEFGFKMPKSMHPEFGAIIQGVTDREGRELLHEEIFKVFSEKYLTPVTPYAIQSFHVHKRHVAASENDSFADIEATLLINGEEKTITASGNGPLDAFCSALKAEVTGDFRLRNYHEHALNSGSSAKAAAYIMIEYPDGSIKWGVAVDTDIIIASVKAVLSSLNRSGKETQ